MSQERGVSVAQPIVRPELSHSGLLGMLLVLVILSLVILLGWRDGGRATD